MNEKEKLKVLIPHWIEHNNEHAAEFRRWTKQAGSATPDLLAAADAIAAVNESLTAALEKLGGALPHHHLN